MSDFDEFEGDITFDEQTLAALELEERKFFSNRLLKRQRTDLNQSSRSRNLPDDFDNLPEISLHLDGTYGLQNVCGSKSKGIFHNSSEAEFAIRRPLSSGFQTSTPSVAQPEHNAQFPFNTLLSHVGNLEAQLKQLMEEKSRIQTALEDTTTTRLTRDGEIATLRRGIQKSSRDHAAQLAQLRIDQEEATAKHARLYKEAREEVERLKTQIIFKNHEQENFRRNIQALNTKMKSIDTTLSFVDPAEIQDSPLATRGLPLGLTTAPAPTSEFIKSINPGLSKQKSLPGFRNTFCDTTPLSMSQIRPLSPRNEASDLQDSGVMNLDNNEVQLAEVNYVTGSDPRFTQDPNNDQQESFPQTFKVACHLQPLHQTAELSRIILSHSLPSSKDLTIWMVPRAQVGDELPSSLSDAFAAACARILEVIANTSRSFDLLCSINCLSDAFVTMVVALTSLKSFRVLTSLNNLITVLVHSFPQFAGAMLSCQLEANNSRLVLTLGDILTHQRENEERDFYDEVLVETMRLLTGLSSNTDENTRSFLIYISQKPQVWSVLSKKDRLTTLQEFLRFLESLASHKETCQVLFAIPKRSDTNESVIVRTVNTPVVDRLCALLADPTRTDPKSKDLKNWIVRFFTVISVSDKEVIDYLSTSTEVIPSIILFLSQVTAYFWEDDDTISAISSDHKASCLNNFSQTLRLLHHLIRASSPVLNLKQKIYAPQQRVFSGIMHHFVVTFSRLIYCEVPEWMNEQQRAQVDCLTPLAKEILDEVVEGIESQHTMDSYQDLIAEIDEAEDELEGILLGNMQ